jgi:hypothetical protein
MSDSTDPCKPRRRLRQLTADSTVQCPIGRRPSATSLRCLGCSFARVPVAGACTEEHGRSSAVNEAEMTTSTELRSLPPRLVGRTGFSESDGRLCKLTAGQKAPRSPRPPHQHRRAHLAHSKMSPTPTPALLQPVRVGALQLKHRVVMAPLTRCRASHLSLIPSDLAVDYYGQRATGQYQYWFYACFRNRTSASADRRNTLDGGLLITEATLISFEAGLFDHCPGKPPWWHRAQGNG